MVITAVAARTAAPVRRPAVAPSLVGFIAVVLGLAGAGRPSFWVDEAATISAATRPLPQLWTLLQHVDAAHGLYYVLLNGWFGVAPITEAWSRLPSALMIGAAAAGVVVLGRQLVSLRVGVCAGMVFAVLPRTTWAAVEARPYALSMMCAVWLTALFLAAMQHYRPRLWILYSAALAVTAVANVFTVLVLAAHGAALACIASPRRAVRAWALATGAALTAVAPLLLTLVHQRDQVSWIWPVSFVTVGQIVGEQYFPSVYSQSVRAVGPDQQGFTSEQLWAAMHAWVVVAPVIVVLVVVAALAYRMRRAGDPAVGARRRLLLVMCAAWIVMPTAALVGYSVVVRPLYQPHYLAFTTPALALLVGLCVVVVGRSRRRTAAILLVIVSAAIPNYLAQRGFYAKYGSDYSQVADMLAAQARPGDCFDVDDTMSPSAVNAIEGVRRAHQDGLRDIGRGSDTVPDSLFGAGRPADTRAGDLRGCSVLWTVADAGADPTADVGPAAPRFCPTERTQFNQTQVVRSVLC